MLKEKLQECIAACEAVLKCNAISDGCRAAVLVCITACKECVKNPSAAAANVAWDECSECGAYCESNCKCEAHQACAVACAAAAACCRQLVYRSESAERMCRYVEIDSTKIDRKARTVPMSFSSEYPALQRSSSLSKAMRQAAGLKDDEVYIEVLDHDPDNVDLSLLNNRGAFLDEHDEKDQLGVVETADIDADEKIGRAVVRLDTHEKAETRLGQMESNSRPHISVGYKVTAYLGEESLPNGRKAKRFAWRGLELSSVAIPADPTIGVARKYQDLDLKRTEANEGKKVAAGDGHTPPAVDSIRGASATHIYESLSEQQRNDMRLLLDPTSTAGGGAAAAQAADPTKSRNEGIAAERERIKQLRNIGDELIKDRPELEKQIRTMVTEAENGDTSIGDFQMRAMREVIKAKPVQQVTLASLGYDEQDRRSYSLVRALQNCVLRKNAFPDPDTLEGDAHVRMSKLDLGAKTGGFLVPPDAPISGRSLTRHERRRMQRDLQVNVFAQGGATVATELMTPIIEILRNRMVADRLGVRSLAGLQGNIVIPRQTGAGTAYAVSEIANLALSTQALDQIAATPKRVGASGQYSKQLILQSSIDVENFMRDDFLKVIAIMWDRLILNGQGANDEPLGIMQTPGIGAILFGAAATWAKLVSFETAVAQANADIGEMAYVSSPTAKGVLKSAAKLLTGATTVAAQPLWDGPLGDGSADGEINGYRAASTNQMPNNQMLFGVFSEVLHCLWGGYDIVVDPFTLAGQGEVKITVNTWGDVVVRHPQCFAVSVDSAAQ